MSGSTAIIGAGEYGLNFAQPPDGVAREKSGTTISANNDYFGGWELVYGKASANIRQFGLVTLQAVLTAGVGIETIFTEVANTANQGAPVGVAMFTMTTGQYGWAIVKGAVPVNAAASIAAGAVLGIGGVGQAGANTAGKQVLGAVGGVASSHTVVKTAVQGASGSTRLLAGNTEGWFPGVYLSGTGIAAGTTVVAIDPDGRGVTISAATTAQINGSVTATYNNATIHYPIIFLNRPSLQGAIT